MYPLSHDIMIGSNGYKMLTEKKGKVTYFTHYYIHLNCYRISIITDYGYAQEYLVKIIQNKISNSK